MVRGWVSRHDDDDLDPVIAMIHEGSATFEGVTLEARRQMRVASTRLKNDGYKVFSAFLKDGRTLMQVLTPDTPPEPAASYGRRPNGVAVVRVVYFTDDPYKAASMRDLPQSGLPGKWGFAAPRSR